MESTSPRWSLNSIDWVKIGKGLLIALVGALLTYLTEIIAGINLGIYALPVMAIWSGIVNIIRKWLANYAPKQSETTPSE